MAQSERNRAAGGRVLWSHAARWLACLWVLAGCAGPGLEPPKERSGDGAPMADGGLPVSGTAGSGGTAGFGNSEGPPGMATDSGDADSEEDAGADDDAGTGDDAASVESQSEDPDEP